MHRNAFQDLPTLLRFVRREIPFISQLERSPVIDRQLTRGAVAGTNDQKRGTGQLHRLAAMRVSLQGYFETSRVGSLLGEGIRRMKVKSIHVSWRRAELLHCIACRPNRNSIECDDRQQPHFSGFICGKRMTSRIDSWLVSNIVSLSIPTPRPAVGGIPYSRARRKSSSSTCASSSPRSFSLI